MTIRYVMSFEKRQNIKTDVINFFRISVLNSIILEADMADGRRHAITSRHVTEKN